MFDAKGENSLVTNQFFHILPSPRTPSQVSAGSHPHMSTALAA